MGKSGKRKSRNSGGTTPKPDNKKQAKMSDFVETSSYSKDPCEPQVDRSFTKEMDDEAIMATPIQKDTNACSPNTPPMEDIVFKSDEAAQTLLDLSGTLGDRMSSDSMSCEEIENDPSQNRKSKDRLIADIQQKLERLVSIQEDFGSLRQSLNELTAAVQFSDQQLQEVLTSVKLTQNENHILKNQVKVLTMQNKIIAKKIINTEDYSRRKNLTISGVVESRRENCFITVQDLICQIGLECVGIQRCHRIGPFRVGRVQNIIVQFTHYQDILAAT